MDGVNQLLKLPLISYVMDNTKTTINQVIVVHTNYLTIIIHTRISNALYCPLHRPNRCALSRPYCFCSPFCFAGRVVLRVHRLEQKNTKHHPETDQSCVRFNVHGGRQRNEVRPSLETARFCGDGKNTTT